MDLDDIRRDILAAPGHVLIEGGPGCGKTTIALLLAAQRVPELADEQRVLFLSFSRAAVRQITDRMHSTLDKAVGAQLEIRTFHAFFLDVVRAHSPQLTGVPATFIAPDEESRMKFDFDGDWKIHTRELAKKGTFVFDRFAPAAADMLEASSVLRELYCSTYPLVIVDEFQDTNVDQWRVVQTLARQSTIVCLADPDQRIFEGFVDGVDEYRIDHLRATLAPNEFDLSGDNHRSPAAGILDYANAVLIADAAQIAPPSVHTIHYQVANQLAGVAHRAIAVLGQRLQESLGREPTIAVLATDNATLAAISQQLTGQTAANDGTMIGPIDHQFHFEPEVAAAAGYVVASVLEWPVKSDIDSVLDSLDALIDFYRTIGNASAKATAEVLAKGRAAVVAGSRPRAKAVNALIEARSKGLWLEGDPIGDWVRARDVLTGARELSDVVKRVRHLRLLSATDDLGWALLSAWDGVEAYPDAVATVRQTLAERLLDDARTQQSRINLMNMHKSKGKEFDGVIVAEGRYQGKLLDREADFAPRSARRRLLRVGLTRARHQVLLLRPDGSVNLMSTTRPPD
ncbi:UvrD-helicase domain-containing protein [Mycobacteroides abscessus]|uniref:ATP-dependent helicase n=1 Tax=Mycobacteroides abscessus TaxID=36809 RepID=A0ABD7HPG7_9MYCO|nr:UvrD-helicase domain-containing protein [Mycobacteroides abscessus]AWG62994.1 ATP-dependent helicase [Mycobacteroides abscessus]PVA29593.1 ATP-dependent helicase [Mycobacteroides abscessus]PVA43500.1 ATP-dependent helicase [Mycobacteroides abscessus]PVA73546.1 ATP-dependent helicase [Mycobacteroides abscessus]PVB12113.1 ATP-dependent helicase [Mycobacteroides abscessus]